MGYKKALRILEALVKELDLKMFWGLVRGTWGCVFRNLAEATIMLTTGHVRPH